MLLAVLLLALLLGVALGLHLCSADSSKLELLSDHLPFDTAVYLPDRLMIVCWCCHRCWIAAAAGQSGLCGPGSLLGGLVRVVGFCSGCSRLEECL